MRNLLLLLSVLAAVAPSAAAQSSPVGSGSPGRLADAQPELFGAGIFSTRHYELTPAFTPDGRTAYFTVSTPAYGRLHVIMESRREGGRWTAPRISPFSGRWGDADPFVSPDGSRLYFISRRPVAPARDSTPRADFNVWVAERRGDGWGEPRHVPEASGPGAEHYVTAASDGTLYIAAVRPDSRGRGDIYRVPFENGRYGQIENLGPAVNSPDHHDTTPYVAPDQSYLIFSSWGRPGGRGSSGDLYVSFRRNGVWTEARPLGGGINTTATEYCPLVSPDGEFLYFTSERGFADQPVGRRLGEGEWNRLLDAPGNGLGDTYRVRLRDALREAPAAPAR